MSRLNPGEFEREVRDVRVYARVDPAQKIMIVSGLQAKGEFVAMTGDGVNDAPAIKRAEIGVAMGKIGTDVSREASSMVLLDDNFATIVSAVREGRRIYDNIRKFIRYVMAGNIGEIVAILVAPFLGMPIPLLPIQILWVNLVTDGLPGLALAMEPEERAIMRRSPRAPDESVFARGMGYQVLWTGILIGGITLAVQWWAMRMGSPNWQTMAFTSLTMCQMFVVIAIRSDREGLHTIGVLSNKHLAGAVLLTFLLQLAVIYIPALNPIFKTAPLTAEELAISLLLPALVLVAVELEKVAIRRGWLYRERPVKALPADREAGLRGAATGQNSRSAPQPRRRHRGSASTAAPWRTPCRESCFPSTTRASSSTPCAMRRGVSAKATRRSRSMSCTWRRRSPATSRRSFRPGRRGDITTIAAARCWSRWRPRWRERTSRIGFIPR